LDFCREQGIAFTDIDKVMYSLQTSKELHHILTRFLEKDTKIVEDEPEQVVQKKVKKVVKRGMSIFNISDMVDPVHLQHNDKKFQGANLAFNQNGEFNKHLEEDQMVKFYQDVIDNKMLIPSRVNKTTPKNFENGGDSFDPTSLEPTTEQSVNNNTLNMPSNLNVNKKESSYSLLSQSLPNSP
jgi:hypothetical protein